MEKNRIGNIETISQNNNIYIKSINSPFGERFYFDEFFDEKLVKKFIKNIERLIRQSREYKSYIELLRTNCQQLNKDNILSNITTGDVDLEFHHYPLSLYDIVETVVYYNGIKNNKINSFRIAKEVMELHYKHYIGLVPLTKTTHELAHAGALFISKEQIFGDYSSFVNTYKEAISNDVLLNIKNMEDISGQNLSSDFRGLL